jgi:hypothetical protein
VCHMTDMPPLDRHGYRKFGLTMAGLVSGLFGVLMPLISGHAIPTWPWIVSSILVSWAVMAPFSLQVIYQPWMSIAGFLGWINTRIVLGMIFILMIVPLGRILRMIQDRKVAKITRGLDRSTESYWIVAAKTQHSNMEKPF